MVHPVSFFQDKDVTIKRQVYVGDKSSLSTIATVKGHLRTLDEKQAATNGFQFGQVHSLLVEVDVDLLESDTVVIDGLDYTVQGVATHDNLSVAHKRALLVKPEL